MKLSEIRLSEITLGLGNQRGSMLCPGATLAPTFAYEQTPLKPSVPEHYGPLSQSQPGFRFVVSAAEERPLRGVQSACRKRLRVQGVLKPRVEAMAIVFRVSSRASGSGLQEHDMESTG